MVAAAGIAAAGISAAGSVGVAALSGGGGGGGRDPDFRIGTPLGVLTSKRNGLQHLQELTFNRRNTPAFAALQKRFPRILSDLDALRAGVKPGFGALTEAGVNALGNRRTAAIGDLRTSLNRRKVLGSSFANDALARVDAEFGQQEAQFRAQTQLAEMDTFNKLLQQEFNFIQTDLQRELAESGFAANVASSVTAALQGSLAAAQQSASGGGVGGVLQSIFGQTFGAGLQTALNNIGTDPASYGNVGAQAALDVNNPAYGFF